MPKTPKPPGLCGLLALGLFACPPPTRLPPPDGGSYELVGRACNVDAECGSLRCDKVRRQCICLSDESCRSSDPNAPARYCNNYTGLCVEEIAGCTQSADCKDAAGKVDPAQYCDSSIRACRPVKGFCEVCLADGECGGEQDDCVLDERLSQKFCGKACSTSADCPRGAGCEQKGSVRQCWPVPNPLTPTQPVSCNDFQGCTPDSLRTCNEDPDCGELGSQRCDKAQGKCVAIAQVCPFGTVCDPRNKICVAECVADADCGDPKLRCANRVCEPIGECTSDAQCPQNKVCSIAPGQKAGQCMPFCQTDVDCPLGSVCQRGTDNRYRCVAGCASSSNCPIDQRCNLATKQCEGPVVGAVRTCQATVACSTCELCNLTQLACFGAKGTFPYCVQCSGSSECPAGACVQMVDGKGYCAKLCGVGQECPQGFVCLPIGGGTQSACVPSDRSCQNKCP
ncbi:MAG: hypothetical protein HYZ28_09980 [Myxococcales bacterium]|nr:hypothetical protein [Myxococcales bacterium]